VTLARQDLSRFSIDESHKGGDAFQFRLRAFRKEINPAQQFDSLIRTSGHGDVS
jgi:hypothetical protein